MREREPRDRELLELLALDRLVQNATAMGANAVLMMRYDSAEIGNTMSEIVAYGTGAVIEPLP